jgi:hypothetical protein
MKNSEKIAFQARLQALRYLGKFTKSVAAFRINDMKFDEPHFKIRHDLMTFEVSPGDILHVGDVCKINFSFFHFCLKANCELMDCRDTENIEGMHAIIAFADMCGRNHYAIFCVLSEIVDWQGETELRFKNIPETKDGSLLLYLPISLKKVTI